MLERLDGVLRRSLRELGLEPRVVEQAALAAWDSKVAPFLPADTKAVQVLRGTLLVEVPNSVWAQELSLMRPLLLEKLNSRLPAGKVRGVRFRVRLG